MLLFASVLAALLAGPEPAALHVRFQQRCVSVTADNAPLRALLAEWAHAGQLKLSGLDHVADRPVTLHLACVDERQALEALLVDEDPLLVPRDIPLDGVSSFVAVAILGRDASLPRRTALPDVIPEHAYPDPMPGRDWSAVPPDADAPPPVALRPVSGGARIAPPTAEPPEATFDYARPVSSDRPGPPLDPVTPGMPLP